MVKYGLAGPYSIPSYSSAISYRVYPLLSPSPLAPRSCFHSFSFFLPRSRPPPLAHTWEGRQIPVGYRVTRYHGNRWEGSSINHLERGRSGGRPDCSG